MPPTFDAYLADQLGDELDAFRQHPEIPTYVRVNTLRSTQPEAQTILRRYGAGSTPHPGVPGALRVDDATGDHVTGYLHHFAGFWVNQSLGSMIPPLLLDPQPGEKVLDLCAAPGSKTTQLAAAMAGRGELWANDLSGVRMNPLAARIDACGAPHIITTCVPGERLPNLCDDVFDRVLADVPCSGLGIKDNIDASRTRYEIKGPPRALAATQYGLLLAALKLARPGGRVVYSTCSLSTLENEAVLDFAVRRLPVRVVEPADLPGLRWRPGRTRHGDETFDPAVQNARRIVPWENPSPGFFVAVLEKLDHLGLRHERHATPQSAAAEPTLTAADPDVAMILGNIERHYGVPAEALAGLRFFRLKDRLLFVDPGVTAIWTGRHRAGLPLAYRRGAFWRLSHAAVQRFSSLIVRNRIRLDPDALAALAVEGTRPLLERPETPYPVLWTDELGAVATLSWTDGVLRWKRARSYQLPAGFQ